MFRFRPFLKIRFTYSIVGNIRRQGRKGSYRTRLRRLTGRGCTCAPALLSYDGRARGTEITHFNPSRYVPVPPVFPDMYYTFLRQRFSAAGAFHDCTDLSSASNPFQHFQYISPHRAMRFPVDRTGHGQQRAKRVSCAFFSVAPYRTAPAVRPSEECTAIVETDRDFADRNPPPHSSPKHPEPFAIFIGDGPLRGYQRLRLLRRRGTRKARKAVYRPSPRPIGRPRFYFAL